MANIFKSKYTGEQIEEILDKANNVTDITPNPEAEATEELTKLKIGDIIFSIPQGSNGGVALYLHRTYTEFSWSDGIRVYCYITFLCDNPNAILSWASLPFVNIVNIESYGYKSNTAIAIQRVQPNSSGIAFTYIDAFSTSGSHYKYDTPSTIQYDEDNVYDMSGNLIDSWASGH